MLENPIILIVAIIFLVVLLILAKKKQKPGTKTTDKKGSTEKNSAQADSDSETEANKSQAKKGTLSFDTQAPPATTAKVSIEQVDNLTEYQVFKQFGYYDKAAVALSQYLENHDVHPPKLVFELCGLYLETGDVENFTESLSLYQDSFSKDELEEVIKLGFEIDKDNLSLRVFAEESLGWTMHQIDNLVGENLPLMEVEIPSFTEIEAENFVESTASTSSIKTNFTTTKLVNGYSRIVNIDPDEKNSIEGLVAQEKAAKLLYGKLEYSNANRLLNTALTSANRPANLALSALELDHKYGDIDNYAKHLWWLFKSLGERGRSIKGRMLSWGYSLGNHSVFIELESPKNDIELKEIGIVNGFVDSSLPEPSVSNPHPLVVYSRVETKSSENQVNRMPSDNKDVRNIIEEIESQLAYGQVNEAIDALEHAIMEHSQEVALYTILFDLYERSENWLRFIRFSRKIRTELDDIPDEIIIHMDRLNQKTQ